MHPPRDAGITHDLSEPGARPLCGAEPSPDASQGAARRVNCAACLRLQQDHSRRSAHSDHSARHRAEESED